ncbi:MAG: FGGY-family carbohydrate kinase [Acidiferrobacter sp.]
MGRERLFLGIDLGTSGARIGLLDEAGRRRGVLAQAWPPGQSLSPSTWLRQTLRLIAQVRQGRPSTEIAAIAIDGTSGTTFLCDTASGRPLTPVLAYNDGRATSEAVALAAGGQALGAASGPYGGPAKLLWLTRYCAPPVGAGLTAQAPWLTGTLLGHHRLMDEHNALKLGFDGAWAPILREPPFALRLPHIVPAGTPLGPLSPTFTRRLGLRDTPLIVAGTTDSTAAFLALGSLPAGCGVSSLGSTLVLKMESAHSISVPEFGIYSHRLAHTWLVGGASNSGAAVLAHFFDRPTLTRLSATLPLATSPQLDYYPLLKPGERFPVSDPRLAPRVSPRPRDDRIFLQGLLEGLAAIEARGYALLARYGAPRLQRVVTAGGGAANSAWRAIREQALRVPVSLAADRPAALGAARLARAGWLDAHESGHGSHFPLDRWAPVH